MKRMLLVNIAGAVGYLFALLGWLWASVLVITNTDLLEKMEANKPAPMEPILNLPEFSLPEPIGLILIGIFTIIMIGLTIYAVITPPKAIVKKSSQVTHQAADKLTKLATGDKQVPKKKRQLITSRMNFYIKLAILLPPLIATACLVLLQENNISLPPHLAILVSSSLSLLTMVSFGLEYLLAKLLKVDPTKIL